VTSENEEAAKKAIAWIKNITREIKVGEVFQGKVKRIFDFGALIELLPGQEGLIHISKLAPFRVKRVDQIVKVGEIVPVKVISIDEQGRINLSLLKRIKK
jgi:polyribonucleotide nucleotidyltransferase